MSYCKIAGLSDTLEKVRAPYVRGEGIQRLSKRFVWSLRVISRSELDKPKKSSEPTDPDPRLTPRNVEWHDLAIIALPTPFLCYCAGADGSVDEMDLINRE